MRRTMLPRRPLAAGFLFSACLLLLLLTACGSTELAAPGETDGDQVSVGYGSQKDSLTTGAISSVSVEDEGKRPVAHLEELLEGNVAGVQVLRTGSGFASTRTAPGAA